MQHLDHLRLAALDHDPPTSAELAHLGVCAACRAERDSYAALADLAVASRMSGSARQDGVELAPLTNWTSLAAELRSEGLLRTTAPLSVVAGNAGSLGATGNSAQQAAPDSGASVTALAHTADGTRGRAHQPWSRTPWMLRAAAAMVLVLGGAMFGRISAGGSVAGMTPATVAAVDGTPSFESGSFGSVEEATRVLTTAQRDYERASLWLASNDTTVRSPDVYRARLAALDQMMAASRAALRDAPQDPVLNHYYLAAYTAREATLQQLIGTLPVDKTLEGF